MMIIFFISSGLFLGWSLGANDASNIIGSAVGSRMVSFAKAAIIASVFVVIGAVVQGGGASDTLGRLGSVNTIGGAFTVALAAGITVYLMTRAALPVSSTQAIVGAIIGWNIFTDNTIDTKSLLQIITTWFTGPVLGACFAFILYHLVRSLRKRIKMHLLRYESYIRACLIIVGAFGAYSLGANNIANVMGVFVPSIDLEEASFGIFRLSGAQQLFLLGGIAISAGIVTYSKKVIQTLGNNLLELTPEAALVVVLAQALVLFIFSSSTLSHWLAKAGLPPIPLVPVSSSQVIVGSIIGVGLYNGARNINFKLLGHIASGWLTAPVAAGILSFLMLFFVKNLFGIDVGHSERSSNAVSAGMNISTIVRYSIIVILIFAAIYLIYMLLNERNRTRKITSNALIKFK